MPNANFAQLISCHSIIRILQPQYIFRYLKRTWLSRLALGEHTSDEEGTTDLNIVFVSIWSEIFSHGTYSMGAERSAHMCMSGIYLKLQNDTQKPKLVLCLFILADL